MFRAHKMAAVFALALGGCGDVEGDGHDHDHDHDHDHNHGVITTVTLEFAPDGDGEALSFSWSDPEDDGSPVVDDINLTNGTTYAVSVKLFNDLADPVEEVTGEILELDTEHQFFFTGAAVQSPATGDNASALVEQSYADEDANGLPLGLENTVTALAAGSDTMNFVLRHLPPEDGAAVKVEGLADDVAANGFGAIGGDNDINIDFTVNVK